MKTCPVCGLINPDTAEKCDCGYDFKSKSLKSSNLVKKSFYSKYDKWKRNGRFSSKKVLLMGFIGLFILGWLLWYAYDRAGISGTKYFIPLIFLFAMTKIHPIFGLFGLLFYLYLWFNLYSIVRKYESIFSIWIKFSTEKILPKTIYCPECASKLELNETERKSKQFKCPNCGTFINLSI